VLETAEGIRLGIQVIQTQDMRIAQLEKEKAQFEKELKDANAKSGNSEKAPSNG
jgi:hypothetical protein